MILSSYFSNIWRKISPLLLLFIIAVFVSTPNNGMAQEKEEINISPTVKEELHRYMGYEELLPKYVSLPYDVTMNTNVRGAFLDIGFLFLVFLPILLFLGLKNNWLKLAIAILMLLFIVMSSTNSYSAFHLINTQGVSQTLENELATNTFGKSPLVYLKLKITQLAFEWYQILDQNIIQVFSGEGDYITYPLFCLFFIALFFVLTRRLNNIPIGEQALIYFGLLYSFLWLILGAGIPWYGILMLPLGIVFMLVGFCKETNKLTQFKYVKNVFLGVSGLWLIMSFNFRMANYEPYAENGKAGAIHLGSLFYGLGKKNKAEVLDELFMAYQPIITEINNNPDALVYRVGTFFQYFIDRNNERVTHDNQLGLFSSLYNKIPNKLTLAKALKKAGYRYMIIDLNTASIDNTPEKSLVQKFKQLNKFLVNNPMMEPIGTDRIIQLPNGKYTYGFSGGEVKNPGSFIAFKIK